jgi:actinorhodin biosynthesis protein ActVIA
MTATLSTETRLYSQIQHFYARQMQALDGRRFEDYAGTFTPDGVFQHSPDHEPAMGREEIVRVLIDFHRKFDNDPVQRRHWFNHIVLDSRDDGLIDSTVYVLVVTIRPGGKPEIAPSCLVHDVIVPDGTEFQLSSRRVAHDQNF